MKKSALLLIAFLVCNAAWAQARPGRSVMHGPSVPSTVFVYPSYVGHGYRGTTSGSLSVNAYRAPYSVGRGEWLPADQQLQAFVPSTGPDGWNWSRVDLPSLTAMVRQNRARAD